MGVVDQMFATPEDIGSIPKSLRDDWQKLRARLARTELEGDPAEWNAEDGVIPPLQRSKVPVSEPESPGRFVTRDEADFLARAAGKEAGIASGAYIGVVTLGAFKAIKVDASYGSIVPGDLLVASPTPGHAMRAVQAEPGTIIGKALGTLAAGTGMIPVLITLN
jgi:hypothetical protein